MIPETLPSRTPTLAPHPTGAYMPGPAEEALTNQPSLVASKVRGERMGLGRGQREVVQNTPDAPSAWNAFLWALFMAPS